MPLLKILGGANGCGKTTYYDSCIESGLISPSLPFLNVDLVAKLELGSYSTQDVTRAEAIVRQRMGELIEKKADFIIESNLAKSSEYEWIEKMINRGGYEVKLDFLSTGDVQINKLRVHQRVAEGGHDVPDHIIEQRAGMGVTYLKSKIFLFHEARLIENDLKRFDIVAVTELGKIVQMLPDCPQWAKDILFIAEKLKHKNGNKLREPEEKYRKIRRKGNKI